MKTTADCQPLEPAAVAKPPTMREKFRNFACKASEGAGSPWCFFLAVLVILIWGVSGPYYKYSDTWQLVINTGTTIITFLMVFLIQNTQYRDAKAMQLKLDELLRGVKGARNNLIDLEKLSDTELEKLQKEFEAMRLKSPKEPSTTQR